MNQPDFTSMTRSQLWRYVVEHRHDDEAFYALSDRIRTNGVELKIESMRIWPN